MRELGVILLLLVTCGYLTMKCLQGRAGAAPGYTLPGGSLSSPGLRIPRRSGRDKRIFCRAHHRAQAIQARARLGRPPPNRVYVARQVG